MKDSPIPALPPPRENKRQRIVGYLRKMVADLRPGDRLPSVTTLEKHFGVATSTVEAAVGALQAEGLVVRRQGAGTFVAEGTRSHLPAPVGRMMITAVGLGDSVNIFSAMAEAVAAEMRRLGYDPILHCEGIPQQRMAHAQERWEARGVDGYVHIGSLTGVTFPPVPGVVLGELPDDAPAHQVAVDSYGGGRRAGGYLWNLGHRRVAMVASVGLPPAPLRFRGLSDALREQGGEADAAIFAPVIWRWSAHSDIPHLETALRKLLDGPNPPTALFFANDQVAFPALQTLLAWGLRVPQDVSVVSFDDTPGLASHTRPALTGLRMPTLALGALAVQTLHQAIHESGLPLRRLRLPAELIVRESAGPPPAAPPPAAAPPSTGADSHAQ